MLGQVLLLSGDPLEAEGFVVLAEALAEADDTWSQVLWRSARARLLAETAPDRALELAQGAVHLADESADLVLRGDARADLGEVELATGSPAGARTSYQEALTLYERKGDTTSAERARRRLAELADATE
jgi:tetratricopeptide (TPR) repeat protein